VRCGGFESHLPDIPKSDERPTEVATKKNLGLMLMAMLFITVALLYVTGPRHIGAKCPPGVRGNCTRHTVGWERLYYQIVPNERAS
jgi:hypothetical protein